MNPQQIQALVMPLAILGIFYFTVIRPQKKREKEVQEMRKNLKVGDKVLTIGGILGELIVVKEDMVTIETSTSKTRLDATKWSIGSVLNKENEEHK